MPRKNSADPLSNRQRSLQRRGSSKAGRPKAQGVERYACGKPKPPGPNERVVAHRRALLGGLGDPNRTVDITKAENALDLALERGWLSPERHRAAARYARLYRQAGLGLPGLVLSRPVDGRAELRAGKRDIRDMDAGEIARLWDAAFTDAPKAEDGEADRREALRLLRAIWSQLTPEEAKVLLDVCVHRSWPQWVIYRAANRPVPAGWERQRLQLERGLDAVIRTLAQGLGSKVIQGAQPALR